MPKYSPGPMTLRCPACKIGEDYTKSDRTSSRGIVRLPDPPRERWVGGRRRGRLARQHRVQHTVCTWTWWTTHPTAARMLLAPGAKGGRS